MKKIKAIFLIAILLLASCDSHNKMNSYDLALKKAEEETKYVLLDFGATWCGGCKAFDKYVFDVNHIENKLTENYVILKIDCDEPENKFITNKYKISGLPHILIIDKDEKIIGGVLGFDPEYIEEPDLFVSKLNEIVGSQNKIRMLEEKLNTDSTNQTTLNDLLEEYKNVGKHIGVRKIKKLLVKKFPTPERIFEYNFSQAVNVLKNQRNPEPLETILSTTDSMDIKHKAIADMSLLYYYRSIDDVKKQDSFYNKLLKINPGYFKREYARFLFEHNLKIDSAIVLTNEILLDEDYRKSHWGQFLKAHSLCYQGEKTKAVNEYNNWMKENSIQWESGESYWPLYFYASFADYYNVELKKAADYLKIAEENRNQVDDKILLAKILYKLGETELAIDKLTESLKYIDEKNENEKIVTLINKYKKDL